MSEEMRELDLDDLEKAAGGMKVRLLKDIAGKGRAGDILDVSDGYAINYLVPNGMAEKVTIESLTAKKGRDCAAEYHRQQNELREQENRKRILDAARASGKSVDEIVELLLRRR